MNERGRIGEEAMSIERDWKGAYEEEKKTVSLVWAALGCKTYDDCKPYAIWEHVQHLKAGRDSLLIAAKAALAALEMIDSEHSQADCAGFFAGELRQAIKKAEKP